MLKHDHLTVPSELTALTQVQKWFDQFCREFAGKLNWSEEDFYCINLAIAEGFTNAVRHAHQALPPETRIEIDLSLWDDRLEVRIWDRGQPFNPDTVAEPELGTLQEGGYGWFLLRRLADRVAYERYPDHRNCLIIVKPLLGNREQGTGERETGIENRGKRE